MIYVDANVFLYAVSDHPLQGVARSALAHHAVQDGIATSHLALDEVAWAGRRWLGRDAAVNAAQQFLESPGLELLTVGRAESQRTFRLMERYPLTPHDAGHAATALGHGCKQILSTDPDFDQVDGLERIPL